MAPVHRACNSGEACLFVRTPAPLHTSFHVKRWFDARKKIVRFLRVKDMQEEVLRPAGNMDYSAKPFAGPETFLNGEEIETYS